MRSDTRNPDFHEWPLSTTLAKTRRWFNEVCRTYAGEFVVCPCCGRRQRTNEYRIIPSQARSLALIYERVGIHVPVNLAQKLHEITLEVKPASPLPSPHLLTHFGLLEPAIPPPTTEQEEAKVKPGWYSVTELGESWLLGIEPAPERVMFRDHLFIGSSVETVMFEDVLTDEPFDWSRDVGLPEPDPVVVGFRSRKRKRSA